MQQKSIIDRSPLARCFRWLFSWRGVRRILIVFAWVATVIALLYGFENWRGRRAWNKERRQLEARGEQLDFKAFIPKPIPDEENFAATDVVKTWFPRNATQWNDPYSRVSVMISSPNTREKGFRHFTDLVAWQMAFESLESDAKASKQKLHSDKLDRDSRAKAAPAVLEGLKSSEEVLAEVRAASARPHARYPVDYKLDNPWGILLPHLAALKSVCQRLQLRACAKLAAGQTAEAFEDVKLILYVADSLKDEPFLISYLVRIAGLQIALQPIWEGLADRRWSEAQLQELQARLNRYNFVADLERPLDAERAAGVLTADLLYQRKYLMSHLGGGESEPNWLGGRFVDALARIAPRGWYYQEQVNLCRWHDRFLAAGFDAAQKRVFPEAAAASEKEFQRQIAGGRLGKGFKSVVDHQLLASLLLPALGNVARRSATGQTGSDHASLACALERFRLANGHFPETLAALVPRYVSQLPHDVITGEPHKYRRSEDGFILYSVGWNVIDDGGAPGKVLYDDQAGDWVWRSSPKN